jgi:hypothetical protein
VYFCVWFVVTLILFNADGLSTARAKAATTAQA